jgi:hypothetical protein
MMTGTSIITYDDRNVLLAQQHISVSFAKADLATCSAHVVIRQPTAGVLYSGISVSIRIFWEQESIRSN